MGWDASDHIKFLFCGIFEMTMFLYIDKKGRKEGVCSREGV